MKIRKIARVPASIQMLVIISLGAFSGSWQGYVLTAIALLLAIVSTTMAPSFAEAAESRTKIREAIVAIKIGNPDLGRKILGHALLDSSKRLIVAAAGQDEVEAGISIRIGMLSVGQLGEEDRLGEADKLIEKMRAEMN